MRVERNFRSSKYEDVLAKILEYERQLDKKTFRVEFLVMKRGHTKKSGKFVEILFTLDRDEFEGCSTASCPIPCPKADKNITEGY